MSLMNTWVCQDCYIAHHYGARSNTRPASTKEIAALDHYGPGDRTLLGLDIAGDETLVTVTEWFAGDSDQRCEGGEPCRHLPDIGYESGGQHVTAISDNTCSDHETEDTYDEDGDATGDTTPCPHCDQTGHGGIVDFTWQFCDGCRTHLGGNRYRLAIHWETT